MEKELHVTINYDESRVHPFLAYIREENDPDDVIEGDSIFQVCVKLAGKAERFFKLTSIVIPRKK